MANNQYVNKVVYGGTTLIDTSDVTVTADKLLEGYTALDKSGKLIVGTASAGAGSAITVTDTLDENGGTIRTITAVSLEGDTVSPSTLLQGYTAHNSLGEAIVGTLNPGGSPTGTINITANGTHDVSAYATANVQVPTDESNDFVVTLTKNAQTDVWEPDCTFAEALAAYTAGKNVVFTAGTAAADGRFNQDFHVFDYSVHEYSSSSAYNRGYDQKSYSWSSTGVTLVETYPYRDITAGDAVPSEVLSGKKFYNADGYQVGTIETKTASDLTASGATVTAPAGYYAQAVTKTIASGTAGTPTATKGTVSNHSVTVTPSVTNTTGYITGGTKNGTGVTVNVTELESGTKTITENGTGISVSGYSTVNVNVSSEEVSLQAKTHIAPTESSQTITADSGYDGLSSVQIDPISSTYVGSGIAQNDSDDLTASGATVTVPAGYYAAQASKSVATGSVTAPTSISGTTATVSTGSNTLTLTKTVSVTPRVTTAGYVSAGTAGNASVSLTANVTTKAAATITPTKSTQTIASGTYLTGTQTIAAIPAAYQDVTGVTAAAGDVVSGKSIVDASGNTVNGSLVIQHYYTGTGAPSTSLGENGDIYLQTT